MHSMQQERSNESVNCRDLCKEIYNVLICNDGALTLERLIHIDTSLCEKYKVSNFSALNYKDDTNDDKPSNLMQFLKQYQEEIDPHQELEIYDSHDFADNSSTLLSFVKQLSIVNNFRINYMQQQSQVVFADGDQRLISDEMSSTVINAVKRKFDQVINSHRSKRIIKQAVENQQAYRQSIVQ
jgi:hypothetical protein